MVVKRQDNTIVDDDKIDTSFFLVTVDLWSEDGTQEMNLVLHPSSSERIINSYVPNPAKRRKGSADSPPITIALPHSTRPSESQSNPTTNAPASHNNSSAPQWLPSPAQDQPQHQQLTFHHHTPSYNTPDSTSNSTWNHHPQPPVNSNGNGNGNGSYSQSQSLPPIHSFERQQPVSAPAPQGSEASWHADGSTTVPPATYRAWSAEAGYAPPPADHTPPGQNGASSSNSTYAQAPQNGSWSNSPPEPPRYAQEQYSPPPASSYDGVSGTAYPSGPYSSQPSAPAPVSNTSNPAYYPNTYPQHTPPSAPRQAYTRTLVGPLSANACRLNDEHRRPGIFFLFQDLSIRTEAPEARSLHTHVDQSPILAQTFTEPFMVFSAKRFPGVPDTTALSISFGSQGQKLPLVSMPITPFYPPP
ncbi:hypothetical protein HWV62_10383 [Athelia sp. TMB]|nr:hypothetical protein HWV62_10383 [Athelia sp. TMB]